MKRGENTIKTFGERDYAYLPFCTSGLDTVATVK